jgi:hypothetical protein
MKPREFWLEGLEVTDEQYLVHKEPKHNDATIHVIEYSAYLDEKKRADSNFKLDLESSIKWKKYMDECHKLIEQNKIMREALIYYRDESINWPLSDKNYDSGFKYGNLAQETLEKCSL